MELAPNFAFVPLPPIPAPTPPQIRALAVDHLELLDRTAIPLRTPPHLEINNLGLLRDLLGTWSGTGFNVIWRPHRQKAGDPPNQDRFLELNVTEETIQFEEIPGNIPNRGFLQDDINMFGLTYLQQISDHNVKIGGKPAGLHIEPGIWAKVPSTNDPAEPETVVRMASIPHGTTILAQGKAFDVNGPPQIADTNILPFALPNGSPIHFPEQILATPTAFRSPPAQLAGVTQAMVDNPNSVLKAVIAGQTIIATTVLIISTDPTPVDGGGTANTAFLVGTADGPNAKATKVTAVFWLETVKGEGGHSNFLQLQYTQTVFLDFNGVRWPHVTVATLHKKLPNRPLTAHIDPNVLEVLREKPPLPK